MHHFLSSLSEAVLSVSSLDFLCGLTTVRFYSGVKWLCIRLIAFSYDRKNPLADKSRGVGAGNLFVVMDTSSNPLKIVVQAYSMFIKN